MKKLYLLLVLFTTIVNAQEPFITTWQTTNPGQLIALPIVNDPGNDYTVDFGDGTVLTNQTGNVYHNYTNPGTYTVTVSGNFQRIKFLDVNNASLTSKIRTIEQWGDTQWTSMESAFENCTNLTINATDTPDLSQATSMSAMFSNCTSLNHPLNNWDVSNITNMSAVFSGALIFNQPLNNWDVSNVTDMSYMFVSALAFNQPLNNWDTSNVTNMAFMFSSASSFNQTLNDWNVSNVTDMSVLFQGATAFNQPLNSWDVSNVTNMYVMFGEANSFNQPLDNWDVSNVTMMQSMFYNTDLFNQNLNNWDVSNVIDMTGMFAYSNSFNQPLDNWDVSNVVLMGGMFTGSVFNQPINNWDVSNVTSMTEMFTNAHNFNQNLSNWNFSSEAYFENAFGYCGFDTQNYDALLLRFAQLGFEGKNLLAYNLKYCESGVRNYLINELGWTIQADSLGEECQGNNVTGNVIYDENANGCDTEDPLIGNFLVTADNGELTYSTISSDGEYDLRVMEGNYTVSLLNVPDYFTVNPATAQVDFTGFGNNEELNFCLTANEAINDLNITIIPVNEARPGFESHYQLVAENIGTQTITGASASFAYNEAIQSFTEASQTPASTTANQLTFDLGTILPLESKIIDITMETFTPPTVEGGEIINFVAAITPDTNDYTPADNTYNLDQVVVNSFDPNDKTILQGDEIYMEQTEGYLDYLIRFQNTGTASAITVRIEDVLHDNLDWTTFKPVTSSHDYRVEITDGNQVEFIFDNINLPHEAADEPGSHGFVAYKIKTVEDIAIGDMITGTAGIFFDYNLPIITNSADTEIVEFMGVNEFSLKNVTLYPNPASTILYLQVENGIDVEEVKVFNLQGSELISLKQHTESINVQNLSAGIYLVIIQTNQGISKHRLIKK